MPLALTSGHIDHIVAPVAPARPIQGTDHRRSLIGTTLMRLTLLASRRLLILLWLDQGRGLPPTLGTNEGPRRRTAQLGKF